MEKEKSKTRRHRPRKSQSCVANLNLIETLEREGCQFEMTKFVASSTPVFDISKFNQEMEYDSDLDEEFCNFKLDWQPISMETVYRENDRLLQQICGTSLVASFQDETPLENKFNNLSERRDWVFDWTRGGMALLPPTLIRPVSFFKKEGGEIDVVDDWTDEERW